MISFPWNEEWVFSLIAVNGYLSAVSLPVNAWWTGSELQQLGDVLLFLNRLDFA